MRFGSALGGWSAHEAELKLSPAKTVAWLVFGRADIYVSLVRVPSALLRQLPYFSTRLSKNARISFAARSGTSA